MASNNKVKGLLKGLRYISEIFDNEKEAEMKIGMPTDVKHVAHIGWDGQSAAVESAPSWMNEFKSAPSDNNGEARDEDPVKSSSQDTDSREGPRGQSSSTTDMQEVPKSSKRSSIRNGKEESKAKEKSDKSKQSKKGSKSTSSKETSESTIKHKKKSKDPNQATDSKSEDPMKGSRRKKSKDSTDDTTRRSRSRDIDNGSESGSVTGAREERLSKTSGFEEEEP